MLHEITTMKRMPFPIQTRRQASKLAGGQGFRRLFDISRAQRNLPKQVCLTQVGWSSFALLLVFPRAVGDVPFYCQTALEGRRVVVFKEAINPSFAEISHLGLSTVYRWGHDGSCDEDWMDGKKARNI